MGHAAPTVLIEKTEALSKRRIGIVVAQWNEEITGELLAGAQRTLENAGVTEVLVEYVPGSFELPLGAQYLIELGRCEAIIALGCLIKGETPHFHYISEAVSLTLSQLNIKYMTPVIFGVLTVDTLAQAQDRIGGKEGHKGEEAAQAALQMLQMDEKLRQTKRGGGVGFGKK